MISSGRSVHHLPITVVTSVSTITVIAETQMYRPSLVHYTKVQQPIVSDAEQLESTDPRRTLTGVPSLNALTSPTRQYLPFKPVSLRLTALNKTQGLFVNVHNPSDFPLAVRCPFPLSSPCGCGVRLCCCLCLPPSPHPFPRSPCCSPASAPCPLGC